MYCSDVCLNMYLSNFKLIWLWSDDFFKCVLIKILERLFSLDTDENYFKDILSDECCWLPDKHLNLKAPSWCQEVVYFSACLLRQRGSSVRSHILKGLLCVFLPVGNSVEMLERKPQPITTHFFSAADFKYHAQFNTKNTRQCGFFLPTLDFLTLLTPFISLCQL